MGFSDNGFCNTGVLEDVLPDIGVEFKDVVGCGLGFRIGGGV